MKKTKRGFTLVELVAAVAIMVIIAVVAVPTSLKMTQDLRKRACQSSLESLNSYWVMDKRINGNKVPLAEFVQEYDKYINGGGRDGNGIDSVEPDFQIYAEDFADVEPCRDWDEYVGEYCYYYDEAYRNEDTGAIYKALVCHACGAVVETNAT